MKRLLILPVMGLMLGFAGCGGDDDGGVVVPPKPTSDLMGKLVLNEINVTEDDDLKYIEFYNYSNGNLEIGEDVFLRYRTSTDSEFKTLWTSPAIVMYYNSFHVISGMNNTGVMQGGFNVQDGVILELVHAIEYEAGVEEIILDRVKIDQIDQRPEKAQGVYSYARISNGNGHWYFESQLGTKGETNGTAYQGKERIADVSGELTAPPTVQSVTVSPAQPGANAEATVSVSAQGASAATITYWKNWDKSTAGQAESMTASGSTFTKALPGQPDGTVVNYLVTVRTADGGQTAYTGYYVACSTAPATTGTVVINEIHPGGKQWELYNPGTTHINIGGWKLVKEPGNQSYTFPDNTVVPAGGFAVFTYDPKNGVPFGIPMKNGFRYKLQNGANTLVDDFVNNGDDIINENFSVNESLGRTPDGDPDEIFTYHITSLGDSNQREFLAPYVTVARVQWPDEVIMRTAVPLRANLSIGTEDKNNLYFTFQYRYYLSNYWSTPQYFEKNPVEGTKRTYEFNRIDSNTFPNIGNHFYRFGAYNKPNAYSGERILEVQPRPYNYKDNICISEVALNNLQYIELYNKSQGSRILLDGLSIYFKGNTNKTEDYTLIWQAEEGGQKYIDPQSVYLIASTNSPAHIKELADEVIDMTLPGNRTFQMVMYQPGEIPSPATEWTYMIIFSRYNWNHSSPFFGRLCSPDFGGDFPKTMSYWGTSNSGGLFLNLPTPKAMNYGNGEGEQEAIVLPTILD